MIKALEENQLILYGDELTSIISINKDVITIGQNREMGINVFLRRTKPIRKNRPAHESISYYLKRKYQAIRIEKIIKLIESVYGKENVEINFIRGTYGDIVFNVAIYNGDLTIENSLGDSREIRGLFTNFRIYSYGYNEFKVGSLRGMRNEYSDLEVASRYTHSHLRSFEIDNIVLKTFCLGTGEFSDNYSRLKSWSYFNNFYEKLEFFLLSLPNYLSWESIEGTPYKYLSQVSKYETIPSQNYSDNYSVLKYNEIFKYTLNQLAIDSQEEIILEPYIFKNSGFLIPKREYLDNIVNTKFKVGIYEKNGVFYRKKRKDIDVDMRLITNHKFKGEEIQIKIYKEDIGFELSENDEVGNLIYSEIMMKELAKIFIKYQIINSNE